MENENVPFNIVQEIYFTRSLGARWAPTFSWQPFGPAFCPSGILDFVLRALRALRPYDPQRIAARSSVEIQLAMFEKYSKRSVVSVLARI